MLFDFKIQEKATMAGESVIRETGKFEIQAYERPNNYRQLSKTHVPFSGMPRRHPLDPEKILLVPDPFTTSPFYYEFQADDISFAEEIPNIVDLDGKVIGMARIWVKKGSIGIQCTPFLVEETRKQGA